MTIKTLGIDVTKPADGVRPDKADIRASWVEIKAKYEALAGQAWRDRGEWASGTAYLSGDVVFQDTNHYRAISDTTGDVPADSPLIWRLVSGAGDAGTSIPTGTSAVPMRDATGAVVMVQSADDGTLIVEGEGATAKIRAIAKLGATSVSTVTVTASRALASTDQSFEIATPAGLPSQVIERELLVLADPVSTAVALTIANNAAASTRWIILVEVSNSQTGAVTLALVENGTINGVAGTTPVTIPVGRPFAIKIRNPTGTAPIVTTGFTQEDSKLKTVSATGALNFRDHNGRKVLTTGNVTIPTVEGMHGIIKAGGAHTITFNSTVSAALTAGDEAPYVVSGAGTTIDIHLTPTANRLAMA